MHGWQKGKEEQTSSPTTAKKDKLTRVETGNEIGTQKGGSISPPNISHNTKHILTQTNIA
jgi:hypothetical protein